MKTPASRHSLIRVTGVALALIEMLALPTIAAAQAPYEMLAVFEAHGKKEGSAQALSAVTDWLAIATLQ